MENIDSDLNLVEDSLGMSCCPIGEVCSWVREEARAWRMDL